MEIFTVLKGNMRKQKSGIIGIFILMTFVSLFLSTVLSIQKNARSYEEQELTRLGFGDITAWVENVPDIENLVTNITAIKAVQQVNSQPLIFSEYSANGIEADTRGQLLHYQAGVYQYYFFNESRNAYVPAPEAIKDGEIYVSPALASLNKIKIGDTIHFEVARQSATKDLLVKGFFEDPFMGSSMIGMKSFLISNGDFQEILQGINRAGNNALASSGSMLHLFQSDDSHLSLSAFNQEINSQSELSNYTESVHTRFAISGFMLILQNIFSALLLAFVVVLVIVTFIVIGYNISGTIQQEYKNLGILKAIGFTNPMLQKVQLIQYLIGIIGGMGLGFGSSIFLIPQINRLTLTTTGLLLPNDIAWQRTSLVYGFLLLALVLFIFLKTRKVSIVRPLAAILDRVTDNNHRVPKLKLKKKCLVLCLSLRQLIAEKKSYRSVAIISALLVFFISLILRMNVWLGPNGEGMMNAFNPADLDIGVERLGNVSAQDVETIIQSQTNIEESYQLLMPTVRLDGVDATANVITDASRFHILTGRSIEHADEVVLTEFIAENLNVKIGDEVRVGAGSNSENYRVVGIYQCANEMGNNLGMSQAGYERIGDTSQAVWCTHYFLEDSTRSKMLIEQLKNTYGGDVHVHENTWSGLESIVAAMKLLTRLMYVVVALFTLVVVILTGSKILFKEQKDQGIYKALGFSSSQLRLTFALRFGTTAFVGSLIGSLLSQLLTNLLVSSLLRLSGISNFSSHLTATTLLLPISVVVGLFFIISYLFSRKIKKVDLTKLIQE